LRNYWRHFWHFQRNARLFLVSNWLNGVAVGIFTVLYNLYLLALGYNTAFIGWILLVATAAGGIAIFPAGIFVDWVGGKQALLWGSFGAGIAGAAQLIVRQPAALLASSAVVGAVAAIFLVVTNPFLANNSREDERAYLFSLNTALTLAAGVVGAVLGGFLPGWLRLPIVLHSAVIRWLSVALAPGTTARSYQLALLIGGILAVPSLVPIILMRSDFGESLTAGSLSPTPPRSGPEARSSEVRDPGLPDGPLPPAFSSKQRGGNGGRRGRVTGLFIAGYEAMNRRAVANNLGARIGEWLTGPVGRFALVEALLGLGAGLFIPYFNVYFVTYQRTSTALYGIISAGGTILMALATLGAPLLSARFGKVRAALYTELCSLPFLILLGLSYGLPLAIAAYLARGSLMNMAEPVLNAYMMEAVPQGQRGAASSAFNLSFQGLWALGAVAGGQLIAAQAYLLTFGIALVLYLCSAGFLWLFFIRR
jgi:MFS family permease